MWDYHNNQWLRDNQGNIITKDNPECDWTPASERQEPNKCDDCIFKSEEGCSRWELYSEVEACDINLKSDLWHKVPEDLPKDKDWKDALFIVYNKKNDEYHYNQQGYVKDKTFKRLPHAPEGEVIAWRYVKDGLESNVHEEV